MNTEVVVLWEKQQIVVLMRLPNVQFKSLLSTWSWVNREMVTSIAFGQVLVSTDICIVKERVYCHSTVVDYGSITNQDTIRLVCKLLTCSCTLVKMFGLGVIARGQH